MNPISHTEVKDLHDAAVTYSREAGRTSLTWFRKSGLNVETKSDGTPVTEADRTVEHQLRESISRDFPDDGILGEEEAEHTGASGRRWIIDPIDGTKAFIRGVPLYSQLIGVEADGQIVAGVINLPALGVTVHAYKDGGAWVDDTRIHVSSANSLNGSCVTCTSFDDWPLDAFTRFRESGTLLRTWGDGYGYALAAMGEVEAMIDFTTESYDLSPMPIILTEAGGHFTNHQGEVRIDTSTGLATSPQLQGQLLEMLEGQGRQ